jgi:hypothetical protein
MLKERRTAGSMPALGYTRFTFWAFEDATGFYSNRFALSTNILRNHLAGMGADCSRDESIPMTKASLFQTTPVTTEVARC